MQLSGEGSYNKILEMQRPFSFEVTGQPKPGPRPTDPSAGHYRVNDFVFEECQQSFVIPSQNNPESVQRIRRQRQPEARGPGHSAPRPAGDSEPASAAAGRRGARAQAWPGPGPN